MYLTNIHHEYKINLTLAVFWLHYVDVCLSLHLENGCVYMHVFPIPLLRVVVLSNISSVDDFSYDTVNC